MNTRWTIDGAGRPVYYDPAEYDGPMLYGEPWWLIYLCDVTGYLRHRIEPWTS